MNPTACRRWGWEHEDTPPDRRRIATHTGLSVKEGSASVPNPLSAIDQAEGPTRAIGLNMAK
jgi:hypothetical protein